MQPYTSTYVSIAEHVSFGPPMLVSPLILIKIGELQAYIVGVLPFQVLRLIGPDGTMHLWLLQRFWQ